MYSAVQEAQFSAEKVAKDYLRACGWKTSSHNPAHFVLWTRRIDNHILLMTADMAVLIQSAMDEWERSGDLWNWDSGEQ